MNRGVWIGMAIAAAIFVVIYLGIAAMQRSLNATDALIAIGGGLACAAVAAVIGTYSARRRT